jgi:hypothetical protein
MPLWFGFETKVFGFASRCARQQHPADAAAKPPTVLLVFTPDGQHEVLTTNTNPSDKHSLVKELRDGGRSFLSWDPYGWPEDAWMEWQGLSRAAMERLLGAPFQDDDFVNKLDARQQDWPERWGASY